MNISSILPAYNEALNIEKAINTIKLFFLENKIKKWEIIVINDGSTDKTLQIIEQISSVEKHVKIINHQLNRGYGETIFSGIKEAQHDWLFITDSDLQFYIEDLSILISHAKNYNFIQGIRTKRQDAISRIILGKIYKTIVKIFFQVPLSDPECSFRLLKKNLIRDLDISTRGPMVPIELILKAKNNNAVFKELSVRHRIRQHGETNAVSLLAIKKIFVDFIHLTYKYKLKSTRN